MTTSVDPLQDLVQRLDGASLTLLVEDREGELYHLPPELRDLATLHTLWVYMGGYASAVSTRFLTGLRRGLKIPSADQTGEAVGNAISRKVARLGRPLTEKRSIPSEEMVAEATDLNEMISAIKADPVDEAVRLRIKEQLRDDLIAKGATGRQAAKIANEIDRTVFGGSES